MLEMGSTLSSSPSSRVVAATTTTIKKTIEIAQNNKQYIIRDGLRFVIPYWLDFSTGCRDRWIRRKVFEVYRSEFPYFSEQYLKKAFELGRLKQNNKVIHDLDTVMEKNKSITHRVHFHEKPIYNRNINILYDEKDLLVVDKPPSFPIHPCGRYRKNSLTFILEEAGYNNLHTVHRLDHSTSGVLMIARDKKVAQSIVNMINTRENTIGKYYLSIVKGNFGKENLTTSGFYEEAQVVQCDTKVYCKDHKKGIWSASDELGTFDALTFYCPIAYNKEENISLVMCKPITGRTHQIRIHLEALGFPISNDFFYNREFVKEMEMKEKPNEAPASNTILSCNSEQNTLKRKDIDITDNNETKENCLQQAKKKQKCENVNEENTATGKRKTTGKKFEDEESKVQEYEDVCVNCNPFYSAMQPFEENTPLCIFLHSWRYELTDEWTFETPVPSWVFEKFPAIDSRNEESLRQKLIRIKDIMTQTSSTKD
ncbi:hypothetical protein FDP41_003169 [Naegleria fowleri]|uniref:Pseudouridine synthase RsuA/RluA-like domain-containing protein n=1 Tax=Naegleria fowleri TaxID=5763 RepID=A0A6A5BLF3_NAEFO|nr:uncharacterized protein FDP41_003169 [Naegleria fowleri]KAF0977847.1 hypothetical protein FDP41_003169 [Naegleria fowleri]CAG4711039.1 unnamed protein product [Naegleria fowleri]